MPMEFHTGPNGRVIPLSKVRTVYVLRANLFGTALEVAPVDGEAFVSHFEVCPKADRFSGQKRGGRNAERPDKG